MRYFRQAFTHRFVRAVACLMLGGCLGGVLEAQPVEKRKHQTGTVTLLARPEIGGSALGGGNYKIGEIVEILAIPAPHYRFVRWEGKVMQTSLLRTQVITTSNSFPITAVFEPQRYNLGITCEPVHAGKVEGGGWFPHGVTVPVHAAPAQGYVFSHWDGPVADAQAPDTTLANPLIGPAKLKAHFKRMEDNCTLTVVGEPALGGEVTPGGTYEPGTVVKLTVTPAHGFIFNGWQGAVSNPGSTETEILVTKDMNVKATFIPQRALIRAKIIPEHAGKVSGDLGVRPCYVPAILKAEAMPGYVFDGWEGAAVSTKSGAQATVIPSEVGKPVVVIARFRANP